MFGLLWMRVWVWLVCKRLAGHAVWVCWLWFASGWLDVRVYAFGGGEFGVCYTGLYLLGFGVAADSLGVLWFFSDCVSDFG